MVVITQVRAIITDISIVGGQLQPDTLQYTECALTGESDCGEMVFLREAVTKLC